jgi:hypothetical protein
MLTASYHWPNLLQNSRIYSHKFTPIVTPVLAKSTATHMIWYHGTAFHEIQQHTFHAQQPDLIVALLMAPVYGPDTTAGPSCAVSHWQNSVHGLGGTDNCGCAPYPGPVCGHYGGIHRLGLPVSQGDAVAQHNGSAYH